MKTNNVVLAGFGLTLLASCLLMGQTDVHAHTISVTTGGAQEIDIMGDRNNTTVSSDSINVTTSCRSGYNFTISSSVDDNSLYLNGDDTDNAEGTYFAPSDGTTMLSNAHNTWGYFYDGTTIPTESNAFSPVPTLGNSAVIKLPLQTPSDTDINDSFNIYYGVSVSSSLAPGTYKMKQDSEQNDGAIVYQATVADACMRYTVNFNSTDTSSTNEVSGTGTMNSQTIYEGVSANLSSNTFVAPSGYHFIGWNTAQDGTGTMYADGASVTDLAAAGESITLYAMWSNCPAGNICYMANGANVEGTMGMQTGIGDGVETTFLASNYSRTGYGFAGWSSLPNYDTNNNAKFYGPNQTIITPADTTIRGITLYAVWIESAGSLQDAAKVAALCGSNGSLTQAPTDGTANLASVSALTDQRDGQTYTIAKLADGNCWMVENLRLDNQYTTGNNQTDPSVTNESLSQGYDASFIGLANPETSNFAKDTTANSLYSIDGSTASTITGNYLGYRFPRYNNTNTASRGADVTATSDSIYSYGNYYTWPAAIADTNPYVGGDQNTTSICPSGWSIPRGGTTSRIESSSSEDDYYMLSFINIGTSPNYVSGELTGWDGVDEGKTASQAMRRFPNNFVYSGNFINSSVSSNSRYWTSTSESSSVNNALSFSMGPTTVAPGSEWRTKTYGHAIRCFVSTNP